MLVDLTHFNTLHCSLESPSQTYTILGKQVKYQKKYRIAAFYRKDSIHKAKLEEKGKIVDLFVRLIQTNRSYITVSIVTANVSVHNA